MSTMYGVDVEARGEDIRWMVETGTNLNDAARRLGLTPSGLEKWCQRHTLAHEASILRGRNPIDPNRSPAESGRIGAMARWAS